MSERERTEENRVGKEGIQSSEQNLHKLVKNCTSTIIPLEPG